MPEQLFNSNKDYSLKHYFPSIPLHIGGTCKPYDAHACKYSTLQHAHRRACSYHIRMPEITKWRNKIMLQCPCTVLRICFAFWSVYTTVWSQKISILKSEYFNYCLCLKDAQWNQIAISSCVTLSPGRERAGTDSHCRAQKQRDRRPRNTTDQYSWLFIWFFISAMGAVCLTLSQSHLDCHSQLWNLTPQFCPSI